MPGTNTYSMLSAQPSIQGSSTTSSGGSALSSGDAPVSTSSGSFLSSVGDVLGYIANPVGSLINYFANRSLSDRRNRQAIEQWERENEYNLPKNQMQRLKAAGLNPALMYENGANGLVSAQSPDMSMSQSHLSVLDPLTAAQVRNLDAQTSLTKANVEKTDAEVGLTKAQTDWTYGQIKVGESVVMYNSALTDYTRDQRKKIVVEMESLAAGVRLANSNIEKNAAEIANWSEQRKIEWFNSALRSREVDALVKKYAAETSLTNQQVKYFGALAISKILNIRSDTLLNDMRSGLTDSQTREVEQAIANMKVQNQQMSFDYDMDVKYADAERQIQMCSKLTRMISDVFGNSPTQNAVAPAKVEEYNNQLRKYGLR